MGAQEQTETSKSDIFKWVLVLIIIAAAVFGNHYFTEQPAALRIIGWIVAFAIAGVVAAQTTKGRIALGFAKEARTEMRKVVWPTRQETIQTTLIVMAFVLVVAVFLWFADSFLLWAIGWLTGQRG